MTSRVATTGGGDVYVPLVDDSVDEIRRDRKWNVKLMLLFTGLNALFSAIVQWNLFDAYLSVLAKAQGSTHPNSWVGFAESLGGIVSMVLAVPVGLAVDYFRRTLLLRWSCLIGIVAAVIAFIGFMFDSVVMLYCNLVLWGFFFELSSSASEAVFADSLPRGGRAAVFTKKTVLATTFLAMGPGIMVVMFLFFGDEWQLKDLHAPLLFGCVVAVPACVILWFFKDPQPGSAAELDGNAEDNDYQQFTFGEKCVPYLLLSSDLMKKIGAGMTVKFFPLFFIKDFGFTPIQLCMLFCIYPLCIGLVIQLNQHLSKRMGRVQAVLLFQVCGIICLLCMIYLRNMWLVIIVFLLRGSFQNSYVALDRSILMDYTPSSQRGKWNAVESVTSFTWSGSAIFGGILSDSHDYRYTFLITALIYAASIPIYMPLLKLVPAKHVDSVEKKSSGYVAPAIGLDSDTATPVDSAADTRSSDSSSA